jgi:molybdopterin-biosynthesis enzyme MoeA-like protein
MVDNVLPTLRSGAKMLSRAVPCPYGEGDIGTLLAAVQKAHPETSIGSYPKYDGQRFSTEIVVRAREPQALDDASKAVMEMIEDLDRAKIRPNPTADA